MLAVLTPALRKDRGNCIEDQEVPNSSKLRFTREDLRPTWKAFTLIELLIALVVIGILVSLLVGPLHNAYRRATLTQQLHDDYQLISLIHGQLAQFYETKRDYPAWTVEELHAKGLFDAKTMRFLESPQVTCIPFASQDPDDRWVLKVQVGEPHQGGSFFGLLKKQITKPDLNLSPNP
ncbi:MAG: type II secretion system protein [Limisphaerales bacterium]